MPEINDNRVMFVSIKYSRNYEDFFFIVCIFNLKKKYYIIQVSPSSSVETFRAIELGPAALVTAFTQTE